MIKSSRTGFPDEFKRVKVDNYPVAAAAAAAAREQISETEYDVENVNFDFKHCTYYRHFDHCLLYGS